MIDRRMYIHSHTTITGGDAAVLYRESTSASTRLIDILLEEGKAAILESSSIHDLLSSVVVAHKSGYTVSSVSELASGLFGELSRLLREQEYVSTMPRPSISSAHHVPFTGTFVECAITSPSPSAKG